jgi:hypothetical protein
VPQPVGEDLVAQVVEFAGDAVEGEPAPDEVDVVEPEVPDHVWTGAVHGDEDQHGAVQLGGGERGHALIVLGPQREDGRFVMPAEVDVAGGVGEDPTVPAQEAEEGSGRDERVLPC